MDASKESLSNNPSKKGLIRAIVNLLTSYTSLFSIELEEAKGYAWSYIVHTLIIVVCSVLFFIMLSVSVIAYFWDTYRLTAILAMLAVYLIIIMVAAISLVRLKKKTKLFPATREEFIKDKDELLS